MQQIIQLRFSTIDHWTPGITLTRFRQQVRLNAEVVAEAMGNRSGSTTGPQAVIVVIPEYTDYDPAIMLVDHFAVNKLADRTTALAIVCQEHSLLHLLKLYFAYYPPRFEVVFCEDIHEAHAWLATLVLSRPAA